MDRKLDDIFNECYERIRSGESLESCLRSYPQHRAELEPLLKTTFDIGRRVSYIQPRPAFKHWARVRLESAQRSPRQQTPAETPGASTWWRHSWAVAVSVVLVLVLTTGSAMAASSQALPDQPLYPVKLATEQVRLALAVSDTQKAQVQTELVQTRAAEVEAMANAGKMEKATKAAERYNDQFEKAIAAIINAEGTEPQPVVYVPPTETTPPAVTAPPEVTTPPAVTTPPEVTTPPSVTTPSDNTTPTETTKPPTTETQPPATEQQPPTTTTPDQGKATKAEKLKKTLDKSTSKSITALKDAQEKASQKDKHDWQKAIDTISKKSQEKSPTATDTTSQSDNNTAPSPASPSPTKQSPSRWHR